MIEDPYCYPLSFVLINKFDINDLDSLKKKEYDITAVSALELEKKFKKTNPKPDLILYKKIHKELFKDIYSWAGEFRTIDSFKGGTSFCSASSLESSLKENFSAIKKDGYLKGLKTVPFADRFSHHYYKVNHTHPFRDGNGRTTQIYFTELARQAGHKLIWSKINKEDFIKALKDANLRDVYPLKKVFINSIEPKLHKTSAVDRLRQRRAASKANDRGR